ncbi:MAG: hypothetical protein J6Z30_00245 [Pyramidobacter sp.]|nr:hypothetical protein [Pyramidobacter sp.]
MAENGNEEIKALRQQLESELDTWDCYCRVSHYGVVVMSAAWMAMVALRTLTSQGDMFTRCVLGVWAAFKPWAVWVVKALKLDMGFEIDRTMLLFSGVVFCLLLLDDFFQHSAQRAWEALEDVCDEEDRENEQE